MFVWICGYEWVVVLFLGCVCEGHIHAQKHTTHTHTTPHKTRTPTKHPPTYRTPSQTNTQLQEQLQAVKDQCETTKRALDEEGRQVIKERNKRQKLEEENKV